MGKQFLLPAVQPEIILTFKSRWIKQSAPPMQPLIPIPPETTTKFKNILTRREVRRPDRGVDLGAEEVDERHGHEQVYIAEQATTQGNDDDRGIEPKIYKIPKRHLGDVGHLNRKEKVTIF